MGLQDVTGLTVGGRRGSVRQKHSLGRSPVEACSGPTDFSYLCRVQWSFREGEAGILCAGRCWSFGFLKEEGGLFSGLLDEAGPNSFLWSSRGVNGLWVLTVLKAFRASLMISALVLCLDTGGR